MNKLLIILIIATVIIFNNPAYGQTDTGTEIQTPAGNFDIPVDIPGDPPETCENCPSDNFKQMNFLNYAREKFQNKFPFDTIGQIPAGMPAECLQNGNEQDCRMRDIVEQALKLLKFPIWITTLVSLIRSI